ncbi:unannotated protein [freshwater metagenome]|uniref:Unannotated protein n=1 Tax=freshwater metagenome TaxID=449393 RepID=A0A6J7C5T9_9ZZZZ
MGHLGEEAGGVVLERLEEDAVLGDLAGHLPVGAARHGHTHRAAGTVARETDDAHIVAEVLAAELGADASVLAELQHLLFKLDVAERVTQLAALGGQVVEVAGAGQLRRLDSALGARAADDHGEVVRRARRSAERLHLLEQPRQQRLLVEQGLRLLEQVALVRAAATLGHEQELVGVAIGGADLDLRRQVVAGVDLVVHVQRRHLAVAQVAGLVRVEHTAGDGLFVAAASADPLTLLGLHDRSAGVLAHRQHAAGGDGRVLQQVERHETVVVAGLGVAEDVAELLQMAGTQEVGDLAHRFLGDQRQRFRVDLQVRAEGRLHRAHMVGGDQTVGGVVVTEGEQFRELELGGSSHVLRLRPSPVHPETPSPSTSVSRA